MKALGKKKIRTTHFSPKISAKPLEAKPLRTKPHKMDPNVFQLDLFANIFQLPQ